MEKAFRVLGAKYADASLSAQNPPYGGYLVRVPGLEPGTTEV